MNTFFMITFFVDSVDIHTLLRWDWPEKSYGLVSVLWVDTYKSIITVTTWFLELLTDRDLEAAFQKYCSQWNSNSKENRSPKGESVTKKTT